MKREFCEPEIEVIRFSERDVIATSSSTPIGEGDEDDD